MEDWLRAEQLSWMTEQEEQQPTSPGNTTVKPEQVTLPKCSLNTTIALCLWTESTVLGVQQYELFAAHKES